MLIRELKTYYLDDDLTAAECFEHYLANTDCQTSFQATLEDWKTIKALYKENQALADELDRLQEQSADIAEMRRERWAQDPATSPRFCTRCGKQVYHEKLSSNGLCTQCAVYASVQSMSQLIRKDGPYYERWLTNTVDALCRLGNAKRTPLAHEQTHTPGDLIDHDKAPPCQGDCEDCPDEECKSRIEPYTDPPDETELDPDHYWNCGVCHRTVTDSEYCDCGNIAPWL